VLAADPKVNQLTGAIIGLAIDIHRALGPGLLESAYQACLSYELLSSGRRFERQKARSPQPSHPFIGRSS
jgi:GxxExxY protein